MNENFITRYINSAFPSTKTFRLLFKSIKRLIILLFTPSFDDKKEEMFADDQDLALCRGV